MWCLLGLAVILVFLGKMQQEEQMYWLLLRHPPFQVWASPTHSLSTQKMWHLQYKFSYYTYLCSVRVGFLWINSPIILHILESLVHETTIAALIPFRARAVHQILFAQWNKSARFSEVLPFKSSCGAECPARATLTLKQEMKSQVTNPDRLGNCSSLTTDLNMKNAKATRPTSVSDF